MKKILCPSMMCANFENLGKEVKDLDEAGFDIFHLDVMDGVFVPNYGMGLQDVDIFVKLLPNLVMFILWLLILETM